MITKPSKHLQIYLQSPLPQIPNQTLTLALTPDLTLHHLKLTLLPVRALDTLFFTLNGRPLPDSTRLQNPRFTPHSTLVLHPRLPGGGGDGGATGAESRDCYLNMYAVKKPDKVDPNEQRLSKWLNCALTNEPLKRPVVVDFLGNVFNKEGLVEALLAKKLPKGFGHIKGLKDMIPVELDSIRGVKDGGARFQCPITGLEFNGKYKFYAIRTCGHVLSAKALKEVKSSGCLVCRKEFGETDKIAINGSEEEVAALREQMESEKAKVRERKVRKVKNGELGVDVDEGTLQLSGKKRDIDVEAVERVAAKVEGNGKVVSGGSKPKVVANGQADGAAKRFKATDVAPPNATKEVYASIFTSSKKSNFKETYSCRSLPLGRN
ncbi:hypothetical protein RJ639_020754 [Escallonia herrerae]|uniref:Ubiquitin-like domain-containing protein n=1 Tax=Escallonia herrerae TaxID=1293975 RepID=A0AA88V4H1_9ASTE|nr:hypothetical protein RJ639_020754 [Escallonia herrerae]